MLVRRRVIEAMSYPYFEHTIPGTGEDSMFCRKARKLGFKTYLDPDLCVGHMTTRPVDVEMALLYQQLPRVQNQAPAVHTARRGTAVARAERDQLEGVVAPTGAMLMLNEEHKELLRRAKAGATTDNSQKQ
jgi:hypothetical protein